MRTGYVAAARAALCCAALWATDATHAAAPADSDPVDRAVAAHRVQLRQRLAAAVQDLDRQLAAGGDELRAGWHRYLDWESWAAPLTAGQAPDWPVMRRLAKRFYSGAEGLERAELTTLREALAACLELEEAVAAAGGDLTGETARRRAQLSAATQARPIDFATAEEAAWWLAATGQEADEVARVHRQFAGPAIVGQIRRDLVEAKLVQFQRSHREQRTNRHRVQGATVVGSSTSVSQSSAQLVAGPDDARLRIVTRGTVDAPRNTATSGRVRVSSSSTSQFTATADVHWNSGGFAATAPQVDAQMHTTIRGVSAPWLIRRAATRRVQASRGSAQTEGARLVERSVAESMAPRLDEVVAKLNDRSRNFLNFLARTGNSAVRWQTMLRPTSVQIGYLPPSPSGLGAPVHAPPPLGADEAIGLSFHDSAIEGILRPQVAGAVWRDANFAMLQRELTGGNSEEFLIGLDPQRWSVQWSWRHPVRIHFTDEFAVVRFRFERVEIDGVEYQAPLEVRAEVEVGATPQGHEMRTRGQATVRGLDPEQPLPPHYQALLERKFQSMFSPKFYLDGLQFPAGGALDGLSGFNASGAILERGWVHLRYASRDAAPTMVVHQSE